MKTCDLPRHAPKGFHRHEPEKTALYQIVREHMNTFFELADARAGEGRGLPRYVKNAFLRYLECGILAHGFARVRCPDCGYDAVVAFSCKDRGVCPSCTARHMSETAAFLVDRVLPRAPIRQWVLSLPRPVRYILARDAKLLGEALRIFVGEIFRDIQRRAGVRRMRDGSCGAVTGVQRFGGALNLNIHFHSLVLDGVYLADPASGEVRFRRLPPPSPEDLDRVLRRTRRRIRRMLVRKGLPVGWGGESPAGEEESVEEPSALESLQGASIQGMLGLAMGARRVPRVEGKLEEANEFRETAFCRTSGDGFNIEAGRRIRAGDRDGLEQLCRYVLRPPFSQERLDRLADGRVVYRFRRPWPDGSTHLVLEPAEFLGKLAALVPPPRSHLVRYHGIFAPNARRRQAVVPSQQPDGPNAGWERCPHRDGVAPATTPCAPVLRAEADQAALATTSARPLADPPASAAVEASPQPQRWRERMRRADLLKRTLGVDVLACPRCRGRMKLIAEITEPEDVGKILRSMGLPNAPPRAAPARPPPQSAFDFAQADSNFSGGF